MTPRLPLSNPKTYPDRRITTEPEIAMSQPSLPAGVQLTGPMRPGYEQILTAEAITFVTDLARTFGPRVRELLERRAVRQKRLDDGLERFDFLDETAHVRAADWKVAKLPDDILD